MLSCVCVCASDKMNPSVKNDSVARARIELAGQAGRREPEGYLYTYICAWWYCIQAPHPHRHAPSESEYNMGYHASLKCLKTSPFALKFNNSRRQTATATTTTTVTVPCHRPMNDRLFPSLASLILAIAQSFLHSAICESCSGTLGRRKKWKKYERHKFWKNMAFPWPRPR